MKAIKWFPGDDVPGVVRIPANTVDLSATRGIKFERPARYVVNTPYGQLEIAPGDWVLPYPSGNRYIIKAVDYEGVQWAENTQKA